MLIFSAKGTPGEHPQSREVIWEEILISQMPHIFFCTLHRLLCMDSTSVFSALNIWDVPEQSKWSPNTSLFFVYCTIYVLLLILFFMNLNPFTCGYKRKVSIWLGRAFLAPATDCAAPHLPCSGHHALNLLLCFSLQKITPILQLKEICSWRIGQKWAWNKREGDGSLKTWDWILQKSARETWHSLFDVDALSSEIRMRSEVFKELTWPSEPGGPQDLPLLSDPAV